MTSSKQSTLPKGYSYAALAAGIKASGKPDLALIVSETPARAAGVFTTNKVVAAPVTLSLDRLKRNGTCQAILINSGNANACTGAQGMRDTTLCSEMTAQALGIDENLIAVASTGVIGVPLPMPRFIEAIPLLPTQLADESVDDVAQAMMTTDSFAKKSAACGSVKGNAYSIVGIAKGAGMIHPNMATMLGFILTDACVEATLLQDVLRRANENSFNSITVDRDTSTNDTVLLLANGASEGAKIVAGTPEAETFEAQIAEVMLDLAKMIVRDGEGATKLVTVQVRGARDRAAARQVAESIATSNLVKTAFFGEDANWGRIIAAAGYSGAEVDPNQVSILFGEIPVVKKGLSTGATLEAEATKVLKTAEFTVTIDLGLGEGEAAYYTSDLTFDYVKINASYRS